MTDLYDFDHHHDAAPAALVAMLGGKGANIAVMTTELGLPVPPGFTITTELCRAYLADGWPDGLDAELRSHVGQIESAVGRRFGGPGDPLLVSVRSGAPVSMPGMMDTIPNLGLNEATAQGLAAASGDQAFAAACRSRFETMYGEVTGAEEVSEDPWEQLRQAVEAVFRSWNSDRARSYRDREGIPDDMGTGVTVQAMVFGNWGENSGSGVVFTRNPATGERSLYGDVMFNAQGEDVVAGTHTPEPISALDERMPAVAAELREYCDVLERHYRDVCDIEFTIERGKLWMLQVRIGKRSPQAGLRMAIEMAEDDDFPLSRAEAVQRVARYLEDPPTTTVRHSGQAPPVVEGLGASPGLVSGRIATTPEAVTEMTEAGQTVILVRRETSPDDVPAMARAAGILTSTGGLASHAAVVARGWGIPAVVAAKGVGVAEDGVSMGEHRFAIGDVVTIDGASGEVFASAVDGQDAVVPEAIKLLAWARELEVEGTGDEERTSTVATTNEIGADEAGPTPEVVIRVLFVKGFATSELLAPAVLAAPETLDPVIDAMTGAGLIAETAGMFQLTDNGKTRGLELMTADRNLWGAAEASAALDAFLPLDLRIKKVVTAWQMSEVDGKPVLNDHSDADYDAAVLADFAAIHDDAIIWLEPWHAGLPRLADYSTRLEHAANLVAGGDHMFIASPRVDSYHSIWFELHEDLIHLAGRTRADEVDAGRA